MSPNHPVAEDLEPWTPEEPTGPAIEPVALVPATVLNATEFREAERGHPDWFAAGLLLPLAWWTLRGAFADEFWCFLDFVNLPFHEAGHIFFSPFGSTLHILGGTLGQLLVPAALGGWFLLREERQRLGALFCLWWFGENFVNIARYMADARDLALPLAGGGDHDWNELFFRWNLLTEPRVRAVAGATRAFGLLVMIAALAACAALAMPAATRDRLAARAGLRR